MVFFGKYEGTFKRTGFYWVNPFMNKKKLSLRARNLDVEPIKVNDKIGIRFYRSCVGMETEGYL